MGATDGRFFCSSFSNALAAAAVVPPVVHSRGEKPENPVCCFCTQKLFIAIC